MGTLKKIFSIFLRIFISAVILILLFRQVDKKAMFEIIKNADKPLLFLAFFVFFLIYVLCLFRWEHLLKALQIHLPLKRIIISSAGSHFFNLFLPSTIGGDLMRSVDLAAHTNKPKEIIATVLLDRLSGFVGLVILAVLSLALGQSLLQDKAVLLSVAIIVAVLTSILFVLFNSFLYAKINRLLHSPNAGKIRQLIKNLHDEVHLFKHKRKVIIVNLIISILVQAVSPLSFYFIALALGLKIKIIYFFIFSPIISAITLLPISIGGLGLRDASNIYFFAKIGVSKDLAFAMSLINFIFILIIGSMGGIIYVLTIRHRRIQHHSSSCIHPSQQ